MAPIKIEEAIDRLGMGRFQYQIFFATGLSVAADAMEVLLLSFLSTILTDVWDLSEAQEALLTSSVFWGALTGTIFFGVLGDRIGRRPTFLLAALVIALFGLLSAFATDYGSLVATRFVVGVGIGGVTIPFDAMAEFLPHSHRGSKLLALQYFWTIGTLLVLLSAYISLRVYDNNWRLLVLLCAVPCWISALVGLFCVPESPRWLLATGRTDKALVVLRHAAQINGLDGMVLYPEGTVLTEETPHNATLRDLFVRPEWRTLITWLSVVWGGFGLLYYATVIAITVIFAEPDKDNDFDYEAIFTSVMAEFVGLTLVIFTVDSWGRVPSQVYSYVLGGLCVGLLCVGSHFGWARPALVALAFGARMFMMSGACVTWTATAELLTTEIRTTGHSLVNAMARVTGSGSPFLVQGGASQLTVGSILLAVSLVTAFCSYQLPETKGLAMGTAATTTTNNNIHTPIPEQDTTISNNNNNNNNASTPGKPFVAMEVSKHEVV